MVIESPLNASIKLMVDRSHFAGRTSLRPLDHRDTTGQIQGGHYRASFVTGLTTVLNAGDAIFALRWNDNTRNFVLNRLRVWATIATAFTTAQEISLDLIKLSAFTAPATGGTDMTANINGGTGRRSSSMAPSLITDVRVATTVALGAGTAVADALPCGFAALGGLVNVVGAMASENLYSIEPGQEYPLELTRSEGFRIRIGVTQGAVGVVRYNLLMDWVEIPSPLTQ